MLKLLLADDEEMVCNTISNLIDWESMGIQLIGPCFDGVDAYYTILDEAPQIVMTDIRMPGISGLELIERISRTNLNTHFIILTGYSEFEYAKAAMKYGVRHYLLKPCDEVQIMECIRTVMNEYRGVNEKTPFSSNLQKSLIYNIIQEGIPIPDLDSRFFISYSHYLDLSDTPYQLYQLHYLEKENLEICLAAIDEYFSRQAPGLIFYKIYVSNVLLFFFPDYAENYDNLDAFLHTLTFPHQTTSCTFIRTPYPDLISLLTAQIPKLKRFDVLYFIDGKDVITKYNYSHIVLRINQLMEQLIDADTDTEEYISELRNVLEAVTSREFLIQLVNNLLISLNIKLSRNSLSVVTDFLVQIHQMDSMEEILNASINKVLSLLTDHRNSCCYSAFIEKLMQYTTKHFSDQDLTLKWIAENYLYMNVNYVSRRFFQETNQKFSAYLMNLRVQKAKELLAKNKNTRIQDIAEMVGCGNNPYYFSRIFKKCTGLTPSAYITTML